MRKIYYLGLLFSVLSFGQADLPLTVNIQNPLPVCSPGDCVNLMAEYRDLKETTSYQVQSIGFAPIYPFNGGTVLDASNDDVWSPVFQLPFPFCFYGQKYTQVMVGSNGVITFNIAPSVPGGIPGGVEIPLTPFSPGFCNWNFNQSLPSAGFHTANAIYGVYQDTDIRNSGAGGGAVTNPSIQNVNYYITGTAPNRIFVANFNQLPAYQCGASQLQTSQVLLYETTNVIDILISKRTPCASWQGGAGVVGIQNQSGTLATIPPGRNTGAWSATNEAWRFIPDGNSTTTLSWSLNGVSLNTSANPLTVCPTEMNTYQAFVSYADCQGEQTVLYDDITVNIETAISLVANPLDITACAVGSQPATFDLTQNTAVILNGQNPLDYEIKYYSSPSLTTYISNAEATSFVSSGQTIGVEIIAEETGCSVIKTFDLIVNTIPAPPTGNTLQYFVPGETLADIELTGGNIVWFSQENGGMSLPNTTALVDGTTYYAATSDSGCLSGKSNPGRLAVSVYNALSNPGFEMSDFRIFPNPVKDILNISYANSYEKEISAITVENLLGQVVMTKTIHKPNTQLDLSAFERGTYLVKITVGNAIKTVKIIKE
ncbi:T9SS type A sorting domain-containing protein [Flavobacterium humi]|uniref:T9SS type A sorting domain-containing protein n=1 Tax=Flavobacterium humi TaxID=2562683 RepID=A0A4Z0LAA9_9FLAO|nr:T9SS type A sorting domain-containing protein [Flavobacterium humi]TGD58200.1 T9SS type A sorting domain-containing protein [Flavobacterium humi]